MNNKQTSKTIASLASDVLRNSNSSAIQKTLAGSALSQVNKGNQTGSEMESIASKVLGSTKYNEDTRSLAGSIVSQSDKKR